VTRALGLVLVGLLLLAVAAPAAGAKPRRAASAATAAERQVVQRLNDVRVARGLPRLVLVRSLVQAARHHSRRMLATGEFSHESPRSGERFDRRIRRFHRARALGETIAWGAGDTGTPAAAVEMWMQSAPHRAILLDRTFRRIGVGRAVGHFEGVDGASLWTADLASAR
jgi:uncharacterized protein YkwD